MTTKDFSVARKSSRGLPRIADVESVPCPSRRNGGPHMLTNAIVKGKDKTVCKFCNVSWAALDAKVRASIPKTQEFTPLS